METLGSLIQDKPNLRRIYLKGNLLTGQGVETLMRFLELSNVNHLNLDNNRIE